MSIDRDWERAPYLERCAPEAKPIVACTESHSSALASDSSRGTDDRASAENHPGLYVARRSVLTCSRDKQVRGVKLELPRLATRSGQACSSAHGAAEPGQEAQVMRHPRVQRERPTLMLRSGSPRARMGARGAAQALRRRWLTAASKHEPGAYKGGARGGYSSELLVYFYGCVGEETGP